MEYQMHAWSLSPPPADEVEEIKSDSLVEEVLIKGHELKPVKRQDSQPNGKFRFIVKLLIGFSQSSDSKRLKWLAGTGWLVAKNMVVTAGHNVSQKHGKAVSVRAFIGYENKFSIGNPPEGMEERTGHLVATPSAWHFTRTIEYDVAFVRLESGFNDVKPVRYIRTPEDTRPEQLLVVGYPADAPGLLFNGQMCLGQGQYQSALGSEPRIGMIKHTSSTYYGSSGAPILLENRGQFIGIGTHRGGLPQDQLNLASAIGKHLDVWIEYSRYTGLLDDIAGKKEAISHPRAVFAYHNNMFVSSERPERKKDKKGQSVTTRRKSKPGYEREEQGDEEHEEEEYEDLGED